MTIVIVREDLLGNTINPTPVMMDYKAFAQAKSLYNTGPTYGIYLCGLFFEYLLNIGGLSVVEKLTKEKSQIIYDILDNSNGYFINPVEKNARSRVNIPFRIKNGILGILLIK